MNLFGSGNRPRSGGESWISGGNSSGGNIFGNNGGGLQLTRQNGNIFGSYQNQQPNSSGGIFGNQNNGNGLMTLGGQNSNGGIFGSSQSFGTYNINYNLNNLPTREGLPILSISEKVKDKSLEQLRVEDYFSCKNKKIPDQLLSQIHNQWQRNQQNRAGGSFLNGSGNQSNSLLGNGNNSGGLLTNKSGGLFGSSSQNGSSIFGGNQGNGLLGNGGGLFGQKSGSLLGNGSSGGLFGGSSSGSLLGGSSGNGGSLFGGGSSGGLFGNSGSGLLGSQNKQGGLFGNSNSGGLFGGQQSSGGLFSGLGGNKSGGLFGGSSSGGLFGGSSSGGLFGGSSGGLFSGQQSGGLFSGLNKGQGGGLFSSMNNGTQYGADARTLLEVQLMGGGLDLQQAQLYDMIRVSFGSTQQNYNLFGKTIGSPDSQREIQNKYEIERETPSLNIIRRNDKFSYSPFDKPSFSRRNYLDICPDLESRLAHRNKLLSSKKKDQPLLIGRKYSERQSFLDEEEEEVCKKVHFSCNGTPVKKPIDLTKMYDSVRFSVTYNQRGGYLVAQLDMHLNTTCMEIKRAAIEKMTGIDSLEYSKYKLVFKNKILHDILKIRDIKLRENDKVYLISNSEAINYSLSTLSSQSSVRDILAPESLLPKLTKDYCTEPSMLRISRMSEDELCCVENFSIYNEDVKVTFETETDIRGLDLDEIIHLGYRAVEVYPENGKISIPQAGTGLNKAAIIEFYKWPLPPKYENDIEGYILKLKSWAVSIDAQFNFYDPEREMVCIKVNNFNMRS